MSIKDIFEKNHFMTTNPITYYFKKNEEKIFFTGIYRYNEYDK